VPRGSYDDALIRDPFIVHNYEYDVGGRLTKATYGSNTENPRHWLYKYNAEDQPYRIVDPIGRITELSYDERGCW